jgi:hypothetical protein
MQRGKADLAAEEVVVEFSRDIIYRLVCPRCGAEEVVFAPVGAIDRKRGQCFTCTGSAPEPQMQIVQTLTGYKGEPSLADRTLDDLGLPLFDIFTVRSADSEVNYCMAGDAATVLGPLAVESEALV